jgi:hypothetical protein
MLMTFLKTYKYKSCNNRDSTHPIQPFSVNMLDLSVVLSKPTLSLLGTPIQIREYMTDQQTQQFYPIHVGH